MLSIRAFQELRVSGPNGGMSLRMRLNNASAQLRMHFNVTADSNIALIYYCLSSTFNTTHILEDFVPTAHVDEDIARLLVALTPDATTNRYRLPGQSRLVLAGTYTGPERFREPTQADLAWKVVLLICNETLRLGQTDDLQQAIGIVGSHASNVPNQSELFPLLVGYIPF